MHHLLKTTSSSHTHIDGHKCLNPELVVPVAHEMVPVVSVTDLMDRELIKCYTPE